MPNEAFNKVTNDMLQEQIKSMDNPCRACPNVGGRNHAATLASLGITEVSNRALLKCPHAHTTGTELADVTRSSAQLSKYAKQSLAISREPDVLRRRTGQSCASRSKGATAGTMEQAGDAMGHANRLKPGGPFMFNGCARSLKVNRCLSSPSRWVAGLRRPAVATLGRLSHWRWHAWGSLQGTAGRSAGDGLPGDPYRHRRRNMRAQRREVSTRGGSQ
jgi:hypothetical protein